jgi:hypothetical protein
MKGIMAGAAWRVQALVLGEMAAAGLVGRQCRTAAAASTAVVFGPGALEAEAKLSLLAMVQLDGNTGFYVGTPSPSGGPLAITDQNVKLPQPAAIQAE